MPAKPPTILFVGGGTGGHIAPLLAVMQAVRDKESKVRLVYVGTSQDAVSPLVRDSEIGFEVRTISAGKLHRFLSLDQFRQTGRMVAGYFQARSLLREVKPDAIFSKGGMVGVPIALAAARMGIPVYAHETDAAPGLANRIAGRYASVIFTAFPVDAYKKLGKARLLYTGQPVRPAFYSVNPAWESIAVGDRVVEREGLPIVTVICGSQGSRQVNGLVRDGWVDLLAKVRLVHLAGPHDYQELRLAAADLPGRLRDNLYLTDFQAAGIPELLHASAAVIARSGGTIFELAASRTPAVLVPLASAAQDHQRRNAAQLEAAGAAIVLNGQAATTERLVATVLALVASDVEKKVMADAIAAFDRPDAAETMARTMLSDLETKEASGTKDI